MKDLNFILNYDSVATTLTNSPDGWDDVLVKYERSMKYWGLFRSYSIPLRFVKEGATILRDAFYSDGQTAVATLTIQKLNRATMQYYTAYTASFDFATFKDYRDFVEVMVVDGGISSLLKSNEGTIYDSYVNGTTVMINEGAFTQFWCYGVDLMDTGTTVNSLLKELVDRITSGGVTSGTYAVKSDYLETLIGDLMFVTTQYVPAHLANISALIKTSFIDFFTSVNAIKPIGVGIEVIAGIETLVLEEIAYFFDNATEIKAFTNVNEFELSVENNLLFNSVKIGWPNKTYSSETINPTLNEANCTTVYSFDCKTNKVLDLTSRYRGDFQGLLDVLRVSLSEDQSEYQYFLLHVKEVSGEMENFDNGELRKKGTTSPFDFWNSLYSPKRLFTNNLIFLESCLNVTGELIYSSSGNDNIINETQHNSGAWVNEYEGATIQPATHLFVPYIIKVDVPLSVDLNSVLSLASTGYITITFEGNTYKGFLMSAGVKLAGRGVVELKLLASYDNDFSTLIR